MYKRFFLRIWKSRKRYQASAKFTTFMFQIAKNYWLNQEAKKRRRPLMHFFSKISKNVETDKRLIIKEKQKLPEANLLNIELREILQNAIQGLGKKYRIVFVLSEINNLKYKEIAEVLNIPIGTVKSRMFIAEKKLRKKLSKYIEEDYI